MLDAADKAILLKLARATLEAYFVNEETPACQTPRAALLEQKGAFVSLHRGSELRGCIGQLSPDRELFKIVQHCVLSAALEDTRFVAVMRDELTDLTIEISVLTPFRRIQSVEEIEVGRHGLYIARGGFRGLLLPQVATQYHWDRTKFLEHTCLKSGLPESAWQDPHTIIHTFEAEVFSESQIPTSIK
jgi:AmmeMemoRadiSam system protein A